MSSLYSEATPVVPGAPTPGGSRCDQSIAQQQKGNTIMTQPRDTDQKPFEGDRYERFRQAVEILANDENMAAAELPFNGEGIRAFASDLTDMRALDGITDSDANWLGMLTAFDFCRGLPRFGWRIHDMLKEKPTFTPEGGYDDEMAVLYGYVKIFCALLKTFADDLDEVAQ